MCNLLNEDLELPNQSIDWNHAVCFPLLLHHDGLPRRDALASCQINSSSSLFHSPTCSRFSLPLLCSVHLPFFSHNRTRVSLFLHDVYISQITYLIFQCCQSSCSHSGSYTDSNREYCCFCFRFSPKRAHKLYCLHTD